MKIWTHTLVKNEENFVWFAVKSVIDYVDKVLLWDTGSTDKTIDICKELKGKYPKKIDFRKLGDVDIKEFTRVRQDMLDATKSDWFLVVDGDEVWWEESIRKVVEAVKSRKGDIESVVVRTINPVGDIFHFQEEAAGRYELAGKKGHLALRAINRSIPGLSSDKPHGTWGWTDRQGKMIQDRSKKRIAFVDTSYLHLTHLPRTTKREDDYKVPKRSFKLKHEIGSPAPLDFYYPEVFFKDRPDVVFSPWKTMETYFYLKSKLFTPLRKIKRRLIHGKSGY